MSVGSSASVNRIKITLRKQFRKALFSPIRKGVFSGGAGEEDGNLRPPTQGYLHFTLNQKVSDRIADDFLPIEIFFICVSKALLFMGSISLQQIKMYFLKAG